ncbi:MAG TPA: ion channel [Candidatus Binatia bacterium]|nr:ion channel [Candidatus Binatia bacterium]
MSWARDLYWSLLTSSWPRLLVLLVVTFLAVNGLFALAYLAFPGSIENARPGMFSDAFFFSVQTMATIGYGRLAPATTLADVIVTIEVLTGLVGLALITGIAFAKFSRPTARVLFSRNAVIAPYDAVPSLMFRMANARGNNIVEAQAHVVLARDEVTAEGERVRRFYDLDLARRQSVLFALSWTAIHPIVATSPLHGMTAVDLASVDAEIVVSLLGFDEQFSQTVNARHRYVAADVVWNARFADILFRDGRRKIDYERFHDLIPLPEAAANRGREAASKR